MHIEIFPTSGGGHCWRKRSKGRTTTCAEVFTTKAGAIRAAEADVRQTIKPYYDSPPVEFKRTEVAGITRITWS